MGCILLRRKREAEVGGRERVGGEDEMVGGNVRVIIYLAPHKRRAFRPVMYCTAKAGYTRFSIS